MLYAIIDNQKREPSPNKNAKCPFCGCDVHSKCGDINIWHWAHLERENCDNWYEPETEWHLEWKKIFNEKNTEVIITKDNKKHIADIYTENKIVIELQNSPISIQTIRERENFYGERMIWVVNAMPFLRNFSVYNGEPQRYTDIPVIFFYSEELLPEPGWFLDLQDILPYGLLEILMNGMQFEYKEDLNLYFKSAPKDKKWSNSFLKRIKRFSDENRLISVDPKLKYFMWHWPKKSWASAQRPIFIDYEKDLLFYVKEGMGSRKGTGSIITKKVFINKYRVVKEETALIKLSK